jgi:N-acetylmuramic acid 6-phosphate etherase
VHHSATQSGREGLFLGIEGGATRTVMLLSTLKLELRQRVEAGPGNIRLLSDADLLRLFKTPLGSGEPLIAIGIGMAGARSAIDRERIRKAADSVWPGVPTHVTHDLETALTAAEPQMRPADVSKSRGGQRSTRAPLMEARTTQVLVLSGTGSCCWGRNAVGKTLRVGGWGHQLGDRGSAYAIAHHALREAILALDRTGDWPRLGQHLLRKAGLNQPDALIPWLDSADKAAVAALAVEVFRAADQGDSLARRVSRQAAAELVTDALACVSRLEQHAAPVTFVLNGSNLLRQAGYARTVTRMLRSHRRECRILRLQREGAWGAVRLAARLTQTRDAVPARVAPSSIIERSETTPGISLKLLAASPTEQRNPRSAELDRMPLREAIDLFLSEETRVPAALRREKRAIERACRTITTRLREGGRLFYVGAGTSGRLGVLDASECPPTFCSSPDTVQGIIAGGARALAEAVEGAEDDAKAGTQAVRFRGVENRDVVVGIAASGRTPFVWGALTASQQLGAATILVSFNPAVKRVRRNRPDVVIAPDVGAELLTGSTRLKAGSATKLLLNMFSTLAMVGLGKVLGNWMVDLNPSNAKLRDRATRLVEAITGCHQPDALRALRRTDWAVRQAIREISQRRRPRTA